MIPDSDCLLARFASSNANDTFHGTHKNFSITDLARLGRLDNRVHCGGGRIWVADCYNRRVQLFGYKPEVQP